MKLFLTGVFCLFSAYLVQAQPSDAQVKKDAIGSGNGVKSFKPTKSTGTRQWNSDVKNWEYVRGVEVVRTSEYAGIDLVVKGDVVYQYTGAGKYSYWKFRILSNEYLGLPNPSATDINALLSKDWPKFYGYYYQKITKVYQQPVLAEDPAWTWHNPKSVEFKMKLKFDHIISYTDVETLETTWNVRLYRDDIKGEWKNFVAHKSQDAREEQKLGVQKYTQEQVNDLQKQTLAFTMGEQMAQQQANAMPQVNVPEFTNAEEMVKYLHNILRNGNGETFKAAMMKLLSQGFYLEGSTVQLRPDIIAELDKVVTAAFHNKATYKQMYCQNPNYRIENSANLGKSIYITGAVNNCNSYFRINYFNTGYKEGVPQKALRIYEFFVNVRQDNDAISFINSFSDRKKLCPND